MKLRALIVILAAVAMTAPAETDTRGRTTPYGSAFFHVTTLPPSVAPEELPSRDHVFEFQLVAGKENGELATSDVRLAYRYASL